MNHQPTIGLRRRARRLSRSGRTGFLTLEVIVAFTILLIAVLAVFQFGMMMIYKQTLQHAATVAVREAAKNASLDEVESSVHAIVGRHGIRIGDHATLLVEDIVETRRRGSLACSSPAAPLIDSDKIRVTICVDVGRRPFLNPLRFFGIQLQGRTMSVHAVAGKE